MTDHSWKDCNRVALPAFTLDQYADLDRAAAIAEVHAQLTDRERRYSHLFTCCNVRDDETVAVVTDISSRVAQGLLDQDRYPVYVDGKQVQKSAGELYKIGADRFGHLVIPVIRKVGNTIPEHLAFCADKVIVSRCERCYFDSWTYGPTPDGYEDAMRICDLCLAEAIAGPLAGHNWAACTTHVDTPAPPGVTHAELHQARVEVHGALMPTLRMALHRYTCAGHRDRQATAVATITRQAIEVQLRLYRHLDDTSLETLTVLKVMPRLWILAARHVLGDVMVLAVPTATTPLPPHLAAEAEPAICSRCNAPGYTHPVADEQLGVDLSTARLLCTACILSAARKARR